MGTFSQTIDARAKVPTRTFVLAPSAFADDWPDKPADGVAVGLRFISEADIQTARAEAARVAVELHDDEEGRTEAFNDALMRCAVARGTCNPNDLNVPFFDMEENVRLALTSRGVRKVWDEIERFHLEESPIVAEIKPEEIAELVDRLKGVSFLSPGRQVRIRKLLGFCLEELREAGVLFDEAEAAP